VRQKIIEKAHVWIRFPKSAEEIIAAKDNWRANNQMPCTIGAIDCTHVKISKPHINGDEYVNRKQYPSINVQATCDSREWFTSVNAEWPGSVHDSRIFKNSDICSYLKSISVSGTTVLLGDSGYGIAPWIIVPFPNPVGDVQRYFNRIYAKERVVIERCFGQVKRRFPCLGYKLRVATDRVSGMIVACFVLHNTAKYLNDDDDFVEVNAINEVDQGAAPELSDIQVRTQGQLVRDQIAAILFDNREL
jgi:hypothetical protein